MARISPLTHCHTCWVKTRPLSPSAPNTHWSLLPHLSSDLIGHSPGHAASPPGLDWFSGKQCSYSATYRNKIVCLGMDLRHLLQLPSRMPRKPPTLELRKTAIKTTRPINCASPLTHDGFQTPSDWRQDEAARMKRKGWMTLEDSSELCHI